MDNPEELAKNPFIIAAIGAAVASAKKLVPGTTWPERVTNVIAGCAIGGFVSPMVCDWLQMISQSYRGGAAFLMGMFGMSLADALIAGIKETKFGELVAGWLKRPGT